MTVRLLPEAARDIEAAAVWYENAQDGLGSAFRDEVLVALRRIGDGPARYRIAFGDYRRMILGRFPYVVYFRETSDAVLIYAVYHQSCDPKTLKKQLG